jgi:hypothetical protein
MLHPSAPFAGRVRLPVLRIGRPLAGLGPDCNSEPRRGAHPRRSRSTFLEQATRESPGGQTIFACQRIRASHDGGNSTSGRVFYGLQERGQLAGEFLERATGTAKKCGRFTGDEPAAVTSAFDSDPYCRRIPGYGACSTDTFEPTPPSVADMLVMNSLLPLKMGLALKSRALAPVPE